MSKTERVIKFMEDKRQVLKSKFYRGASPITKKKVRSTCNTIPLWGFMK